jgi:hypothetical protein
MTLKDMTSAISSPASAGGVSLSGSQDGPMTDLFGQGARPVSPSAQPDNAKVLPTLATSGPSTSVSSPSAILQRSLESKLQQRLATGGSTLFSLTWKAKDTPARRPYYQLVASARRTSGSDFGLSAHWATPRTVDAPRSAAFQKGCLGLSPTECLASWPTPMAGNPGTENYNAAGNTDSSRQTRALMGVDLAGVDRSGWPTPKEQNARGPSIKRDGLWDKAQLASWATPTTRGHKDTGDLSQSMTAWVTPNARDWKGGTVNAGMKTTGHQSLSNKVQLIGWATPAARDHKPTNTPDYVKGGKYMDQLANQAVHGLTSNGSPAQTEKPGQLNPEFSLWLMGYPAEWAYSGAQAMQSSRKSRRK